MFRSAPRRSSARSSPKMLLTHSVVAEQAEVRHIAAIASAQPEKNRPAHGRRYPPRRGRHAEGTRIDRADRAHRPLASRCRQAEDPANPRQELDAFAEPAQRAEAARWSPPAPGPTADAVQPGSVARCRVAGHDHASRIPPPMGTQNSRNTPARPPVARAGAPSDRGARAERRQARPSQYRHWRAREPVSVSTTAVSRQLSTNSERRTANSEQRTANGGWL
jgi:hypothetical protein